MDIFSSIVTNI